MRAVPGLTPEPRYNAMRHADDLPHEPDAAHRRRPTPITVPPPAQHVALIAHGHAVSGGSAVLLSAVALTAHGHAVSGGSATLTARRD